MFGRKTSSSGKHTPGMTSASGGSHSAPGHDPSPLTASRDAGVSQITRQARDWSKENKATILASAQTVLSIVEKGLDGRPVYGPKIAVAAVVEAIRAVQTMDENKATAEEIVTHVEAITKHLVQFGLPATSSLPSTSPDIAARIAKFTSRLDEIQSSSTRHMGENRNVLVRLMDAEHVATQLGSVWADIQLAYNEFIATAVISTEIKVDDVRKDMGRMQVTQMTQVEYDLLGRLQPVKSAFHNAHGAAPACLEGTRTQLLDEISGWMADPSAKLVYWLTGVAGTGKTTIAQSVAHTAEERGCLTATFFFSRTAGSAERRQVAAVIPTVAYQLACRHKMFRDCICGAISTDRDVCEHQVARQAKTLLSDALQGIHGDLPLPLIVVLDGLDECDKEDGREGGDLIPVLLHSFQKLPFSVKLFVTSRPETSIMNMFSRADIHGSTVGLALHRDIEQSIVREDIGRYLRHEFDKLAQDRHVPSPFPSDTDFQTLVDRAGNLFIYVRTIVMYVSSEVEDPIDQLADVLRVDESRTSKQFAHLDVLYTQILTKASDVLGHDAAAQRQLCDILATLVLVQENLPVVALAVVAGVEERQCKMILRCLSSVLLYEHTLLEPVRLIHPSFPDFLTREGRCTDTRYFVSGAEYHSMLALRCVQIMNVDLRRNICDLQDPFLLNSDVPDLDQRLDSNTSAQLRYACKYWHVHVQLAGCLYPELITALDVFCTKHLLHWLELLSLMNEVPVALRDLPPLLSYLESCDETRHGRIHTLLTDVDRLLVAYNIPIIESALHVYWSALVTMPSCLLLEETALHDGYGIPLLVTKRAAGWGLRETILDPRGAAVECIAYAPNGKLIASGGLFAPVIHVWDVVTGTALHTISISDTQAVERIPGVTSVAFSPNSRWIISGSRDCTVRLWDVVTGSQHRVMRGHTEWVTCVAFSPDGTIIVSCSHDSTLRIWDVGTGAEQLAMTGHTALVKSLAVAPNGQTVVSASRDGTLRVWDVLTGTQLHVMEGDKGAPDCVAFSPDGATIASGSSNGTLELWSATNSTRQHALEGHEHGVRSLAFSSDSRLIVSCDMIGLARIWDVTTGIEKRRLTGDNVTTVAYSPDGKSIAIESSGTIRIRDTHISVVAHPTLEGHQARINCVAFSADSLLIASGSHDRTVRIWDAVTGTKRHVMGVGDIVYSIVFSPDNRTVACGQRNGTVELWDVASGRKKGSMMDQRSSPVDSVAFSSDGKSLVSYCTVDGTARVWDVATGAEQHILTYPLARRGFFTPVAFSADGKAIVMRETYGSGVVKGFWDLTTTQLEYMESTSPQEQTPATDDVYTSEQHYFVKSDWIHYSDGQGKPKRVCWLPEKRRGTLAYSGKRVCVGGRAGTITILDFSPVEILQQVV